MQKLFIQSTTNKERKLKIPIREHINKNQKYKNLEKVQILLLELRQKLTELNKNMRNTNKMIENPIMAVIDMKGRIIRIKGTTAEYRKIL